MKRTDPGKHWPLFRCSRNWRNLEFFSSRCLYTCASEYISQRRQGKKIIILQIPVVARPLDLHPCDSVDISYGDRRENEVGKRERKYNRRSLQCLAIACRFFWLMPVVACPLDLHPRDSVDISYEPSAMEKERRYESLSRYFILFNSFFDFFWRLYVEKGYIWVVRLELTSVRLVEAKECGKCAGFSWHFGLFSWKAIQTRKVRQRSRIFFCVFCFDLFFGLMVAARPELMNRKERQRGGRRRNISMGSEKTTLTVA